MERVKDGDVSVDGDGEYVEEGDEAAEDQQHKLQEADGFDFADGRAEVERHVQRQYAAEEEVAGSQADDELVGGQATEVAVAADRSDGEDVAKEDGDYDGGVGDRPHRANAVLWWHGGAGAHGG